MGGKSPSLPPAPDPAATSAAQAASNMGTARVSAALNRVDVNNPYYTTNWTKGYQPPTSTGGTEKRPGAQQTQSSTGETVDSGPGMTADTHSSGTTVSYYDSQGMPHAADGTPVYGVQSGEPGSVPGGSVTGSSTSPSDAATNDATANPDVSGDQWTQTTTLSPAQKAILDQQQRLQMDSQGVALNQLPKLQGALDQTVNYDGLPQNVTGVDYNRLQSVDPNFARGTVQSSLDFSGLPQLQTGALTSHVDQGPIQTSVNPGDQWSFDSVGGPQRSLNVSDPTSLMTGAANTFYGASTALTNPRIQQQHEELRQSLADRGIPEDSEAGMRELRNFQTSADITNQQAASDALKNAQGFAPTLFGMDLSKFNAENAAEGQAFGQTDTQRTQLFDQALKSGEFGNNAQAMAFGQGTTNANLNNSAEAQTFGQSLAAQKQAEDLVTTQGTFTNAAQNQNFSQQQQQQQLAAALRAQGLSEQEISAQLAAQARSAGYTERQNVRLQPINDTRMLLSATGG